MKPAKEVARFLIARKILRPIDAELENWTLARVDSLIDNTIACIEDAERDAWRAAADALRDLPTGEVICWDAVADDLIRHFEDWNKGRETNRADQTARAEEAERVRRLAVEMNGWKNQCESEQAKVKKFCAEINRLRGFCDEFVWGENNPDEYRTLQAKHDALAAEVERLRAGNIETDEERDIK